jgi:methionyl-tRNA formyltransferase
MDSKRRIVFAGTPNNAALTLSHLVSKGFNVVGVLTRLDSKVGRKGIIQESAVASQASELGIPVYKANSIDGDCLSWIRSLEPDIGVVVAYGTIFDSDVLALPRYGWLNLHYSLLPALRGPAPVQNAILRGLRETGVTVFRLDQGIDTGPIVAQEKVSIDSTENSGELLEKLSQVGAELISTVLSDMPSNLAGATNQPYLAPDQIARKPTRDSARLNFSSKSIELSALVRAMNPEPMAWFEFDGKSVRVLSATPSSNRFEPVGLVKIIQHDLVVACSEGSLLLQTVQPAGKSAMTGAEWFRGLRRQEATLE